MGKKMRHRYYVFMDKEEFEASIYFALEEVRSILENSDYYPSKIIMTETKFEVCCKKKTKKTKINSSPS